MRHDKQSQNRCLILNTTFKEASKMKSKLGKVTRQSIPQPTGWVLLSLVVLALLVAACGGRGRDLSDPDVPVRVAFFVPISSEDNAYEAAREDGALEKAKELNAEIQSFGGDYDPVKQVNQIKEATESGDFDVLIVHPIDNNAVVPAIEEAIKKGLIVIGADAIIGPNTDSLEPYPEGVTAMVGLTGKSTGRWLGQAVVDACADKDPCRAVYLIGIQALGIDQDRFTGFEEVIKEHSNIELVAFEEGLYREDTSYEVMNQVFEARPDIDVIVSSGDQMTLGAERAAKEAGLNNIQFVGNGASKAGCKALEEKRWFVSKADIPFTQGQIVLEIAVKAARGQDVEKSVNLAEVSPPLPSEGPLITQDNVDEFECQW